MAFLVSSLTQALSCTFLYPLHQLVVPLHSLGRNTQYKEELPLEGRVVRFFEKATKQWNVLPHYFQDAIKRSLHLCGRWPTRTLLFFASCRCCGSLAAASFGALGMLWHLPGEGILVMVASADGGLPRSMSAAGR